MEPDPDLFYPVIKDHSHTNTNAIHCQLTFFCRLALQNLHRCLFHNQFAIYLLYCNKLIITFAQPDFFCVLKLDVPVNAGINAPEFIIPDFFITLKT